ncbi:MAG: T9SS type A sorting domain-containing protein [Bacteroidia bacterium]|nr:T9SS type A sorting domain-containing protein [Bacteroidia bacterium]
MRSKIFTFIITLFVSSVINAQDYQIDFMGSGSSTFVDSVNVENLTQCKSINIAGSNILHLVAEVGINEVNTGTEIKLFTYPNPMSDLCYIEIESKSIGKATVGLYNLAGNKIIQVQELLTKGHHIYKLSGISEGVYLLKVESETYCFNSKIVSVNKVLANPEIKRVETIPDKMLTEMPKSLKSEKAIIDMQYTVGDLLKLTGKSGVFRTIVMLVPNNSQTVNFTFMPCTDSNGNSYSIVQIGNQWWMAENLNAGTYVPVTSPQVSGTKFCMDVYGQADPNCPMGGLYEWANLMQGAIQCNGTGAPPNDKCTNPVKGLCPNGWHIPSHYEWTTLERNSGINPGAFPYNTSTISLLGTDEGGNLKETCTSYWWAPNSGATNLTGFSGLPGGDTWNGVFEDFGQSAYFWTSTEPFFMAWVHALNYSLTVVGRSSYAVESGFSCRCVKD